MKKNLKRGFTLIELLVVIAIIGILASIILASLATARSKGNDAKVQEQLKSIGNAAEIYYDTAGNYGTSATCTTMIADAASGMAALVAPSAWPNGAPNCVSVAPYSTYAFYGKLSSGQYQCVDSSGASKVDAVNTATSC
jgi:prepilin-type N-terminal cleavage/methylation domain-containing protein